MHLYKHETKHQGQGNGIYVSISKYGSDTPVTRPETDKAGLSSRDRSKHHYHHSLNTMPQMQLKKLIQNRIVSSMIIIIKMIIM